MSDGELKNAVKNLNGELWKLTNGTYLTEDQKKELETLKGKLSEAEGAMSELDKAFQESSKRMLFGMLTQKASADGLTQTEVDSQLKIALIGGQRTSTATTEQKLNAIILETLHCQLQTSMTYT